VLFSAVPANTEYVIQTLTIVLQAGTVPAPLTQGELQTTTAGKQATIANFPVVSSGGQFRAATLSLTAYADPGAALLCGVGTSINLPNSVVTCAITAYTVSLP
jgi:hypothetical protein